MGKNTSTRAHVATPAPALIPADRPAENVDAEAPSTIHIIKPATAPLISRKNKRKQKKQPLAVDNHLIFSSNNTEIPVEEQTSIIIDTNRCTSPPPTPRKEKRKPKNNFQPPAASLSTPSLNEISTPAKRTPPNNRPRQSTSTAPTILPPMGALQKASPLLICSLGNPGPTYAHTLHSAGHMITAHIASVKRYPPFTKGLSGLVARPSTAGFDFSLVRGFTRADSDLAAGGGDDWTFWQSTSLMNVSGKSVARAFREFGARVSGTPRLVVVHDELEAPLGKVSVRDGAASARGHNGIKSCQASLGAMKWWRVGVGIGRPESRERDVVSRFVLRKMDGREMRAVEGACGAVVDALREIAEGKR